MAKNESNKMKITSESKKKINQILRQLWEKFQLFIVSIVLHTHSSSDITY